MTAPFIHDLTVSSSSSMNVFVDCAGFNLNLDHHRWVFPSLEVSAAARIKSAVVGCAGFNLNLDHRRWACC